jgi:hypothetical protein
MGGPTTEPSGARGVAAMTARRIAFRRIADEALRYVNVLVPRWLPNGTRDGSEWIAINPTRPDGRKGSFKVSMANGKWSDFATGEAGGDLIALGAYLHRLKQGEAAVKIAEMLGIAAYDE